MTIRLHIDRLVVDAELGHNPRVIERELVEALTAALARSDGWQSASARHRQVDAAAGVTLGARIGTAVHAALTDPAQRP